MRDKGTWQGGRATEPQLLLSSSLSNFWSNLLPGLPTLPSSQLSLTCSPSMSIAWLIFQRNNTKDIFTNSNMVAMRDNPSIEKGSFLGGFHTSKGKWRAKSTAETATLLNSTVWAPQALHPLGEWEGRQLRKKSFRAGSVKKKQNVTTVDIVKTGVGNTATSSLLGSSHLSKPCRCGGKSRTAGTVREGEQVGGLWGKGARDHSSYGSLICVLVTQDINIETRALHPPTESFPMWHL